MTINKKHIKIGNFEIGNDLPFFFMAGPCELESLDHALMMAEKLKKITDKLGVKYIFKTSYDKANRSGATSKRGVMLEEGHKIFEQIKKQIGVPVVTDCHTPEQFEVMKDIIDLMQIPAFLCRQTDLIEAAAKTGKPIHIKKMQSLDPWSMESVAKKLAYFGNDQAILCDRGTAFGYGSLVNDMRGLAIMAQYAPVTIDCTHSCQLPGGKITAGNRDMASLIASAGVAVGVAGVFAEVHQDPDKAPCDAANMVRLDKVEAFLKRLVALDKIAKKMPLDIENYTILA